jgi:hypothetical protein
MAAAPRYGTLMFLGASGRTYAVDVYISDVANGQVNFDNGSGAGSTSLTYYKAPEQMKLYDFSVATGLTDTTNVLFTSDGAQIAGSRLRYANFLNTIATRPVLSLTFRQGSNVGALQAA